MKDFFSKPIGRRLIIGLLLIALAVILGILMDGEFTGPDSLMLHRLIFIVCVIGLGLGGLAFIFLSWWGLLLGVGFVLVIALPQALPDPWNRYFSFLYLAALLGLPPLVSWLKQHRKTASAPEITLSAPDEEEGWEPFTLIDNSIVVLNELSGRVYQLVYKNGRLYGYWIGKELKGIDETKLQTKTKRFQTPSPQFIYRRGEIRSVKESPYRNQAAFTLRAQNHTYRFVPFWISSEEEMYTFFQQFSPDTLPKRTNKKPVSKPQKSRRAKLRQLRTALMIAIGAIALPWLFLDVPYKLFSALSLLPFPIILATICLFPDDVSLDENMRQKTGGSVEFFMPLVFSGFAPALRTLLDFNILAWKPLLIYAGILLVLVAVLLLVFYQELRQRIGMFLGILFLCIFFCFGSIGQLNYLLDTSAPQRQSATITDMHISTGSKSPDRYVLTVITLSGTEMELQTSKEHYNSLTIGENVTVYISEGGLGIPYAIVD